jgi:hypothetical protein
LQPGWLGKAPEEEPIFKDLAPAIRLQEPPGEGIIASSKIAKGRKEVSSFLTFSWLFAMIHLISNFPQKPYPWVLEPGRLFREWGIRMRGDQLARQWRIIRSVEARSNGLPVAEITKGEETGIRTIYRDLEAPRYHDHAEAGRAPRKTSRVLLALPNIIFLLPSYFFEKIIKEFSIKTPLPSLWENGDALK